MSREPDLGRVREILACIAAIDLADATATRHDGDPGVATVVVDAIRYRLVKIGEAVGSLSPELREDHPAVAWSDLARLPDLIGEADDELDPEMALAAVGQPLRRLRSACQAILGESVRAGEDEP